ncbi:MAG: hypothetical protein L0Z68_10120 [Gammaproteobacteria bacterium]|nr:hypothetical protein [Gammaproteobacteria bacterium]
MAINETVTGNDSIAITGTASAGERTVGVKGVGDSVGVRGEGKGWHGVEGISGSTIGGHGVFGANTAGGTGVVGTSTKWIGVYGETTGVENGPAGVWGEHKGAGIGVKAISNTGVGLVAFSNGTAAVFQGDVEVTGDIRLTNADCAEDFDICEADLIEPGTVMVLGEEGKLQQSQKAYDKRVAGVVSGAGDCKPGIVLDKQQSQSGRKPIALLGKVFCKVDAQYGAIEVGDLLTTSPTPGHAMKTDDPVKALGAMIGKALRPLSGGRGLIPILIALQ